MLWEPFLCDAKDFGGTSAFRGERRPLAKMGAGTPYGFPEPKVFPGVFKGFSQRFSQTPLAQKPAAVFSPAAAYRRRGILTPRYICFAVYLHCSISALRHISIAIYQHYNISTLRHINRATDQQRRLSARRRLAMPQFISQSTESSPPKTTAFSDNAPAVPPS